MLFNLILISTTKGNHRLGRKTIHFSGKSHCTKVTGNKVIFQITRVHSAEVPSGGYVMVRSPSADIDILIRFVALVAHLVNDVHVLIDHGTGKDRKILDSTSSTLD